LAGDWAVDVVRAPLGVHPEGYLSDPAHETAKVFEVVEEAIAQGIYVIVDWHGHDPHTEAATDFFLRTARAFDGVPNVIFETWNEPARCYGWAEDIVPHQLAVLRTLRDAGMRNLAICGVGDNCMDVEAAIERPLEIEDVCYAVHFYAGSHRAGLRTRVEQALRAGLPIFASEYGLGESNGDGCLDLAEMERWWAFLDYHHVSHVNWAMVDKREACAALKPMPAWLGSAAPIRLSQSGRAVRDHLARRRDAALETQIGRPDAGCRWPDPAQSKVQNA